jgi:hypothetical protein
VKVRLPKPYYDKRGITIYHGDCKEILPGLTGDSLVTDPPFGIEFDRATWRDKKVEYPELIKWLVTQSTKTIPNGSVFIFQAMPNIS